MSQINIGEFVFLPQEKVIYGPGSLARLGVEAERVGCRRAVVITGHSLATQTPLVRQVEILLGARHAGTFAGIRQHAPQSGIAAAASLASEKGADLLVSLGGGSPIDATKLVARQLAGDGPGASFLPQIAIPTTLSAAEFSHTAGYTDETTKSKTGFRDPRAAPRVVILDPQVTLHTPLWLWLSSGIRALDHAVETLYAPGYHPLSDVLALRAIRDLFAGLPACKAQPEDLQARMQCQLAAWMSYFSPASVPSHAGLSHTIGKRIGATYDVPHGVTSCILLPHVMRYKARFPADARSLAAMAVELDLAQASTSAEEAAEAAAQAVAGLVHTLDLPDRLSAVSVPESALEAIAQGVSPELGLQEAVMVILREAW